MFKFITWNNIKYSVAAVLENVQDSVDKSTA